MHMPCASELTLKQSHSNSKVIQTGNKSSIKYDALATTGQFLQFIQGKEKNSVILYKLQKNIHMTS